MTQQRAQELEAELRRRAAEAREAEMIAAEDWQQGYGCGSQDAFLEGGVMKSREEHFRDWESHVFGFGYGTGEPIIVPLLKHLLEAVPQDGSYWYVTLEAVVGEAPAWFLINALCKSDIIEYGSSPRGGWLTVHGKQLQKFTSEHSNDGLVEIVTDYSEDYTHCYPDHCNCDDGPCHNPFWKEHRK